MGEGGLVMVSRHAPRRRARLPQATSLYELSKRPSKSSLGDGESSPTKRLTAMCERTRARSSAYLRGRSSAKLGSPPTPPSSNSTGSQGLSVTRDDSFTIQEGSQELHEASSPSDQPKSTGHKMSLTQKIMERRSSTAANTETKSGMGIGPMKESTRRDAPRHHAPAAAPAAVAGKTNLAVRHTRMPPSQQRHREGERETQLSAPRRPLPAPRARAPAPPLLTSRSSKRSSDGSRHRGQVCTSLHQSAPTHACRHAAPRANRGRHARCRAPARTPPPRPRWPLSSLRRRCSVEAPRAPPPSARLGRLSRTSQPPSIRRATRAAPTSRRRFRGFSTSAST